MSDILWVLAGLSLIFMTVVIIRMQRTIKKFQEFEQKKRLEDETRRKERAAAERLNRRSRNSGTAPYGFNPRIVSSRPDSLPPIQHPVQPQDNSMLNLAIADSLLDDDSKKMFPPSFIPGSISSPPKVEDCGPSQNHVSHTPHEPSQSHSSHSYESHSYSDTSSVPDTGSCGDSGGGGGID